MIHTMASDLVITAVMVAIVSAICGVGFTIYLSGYKAATADVEELSRRWSEAAARIRIQERAAAAIMERALDILVSHVEWHSARQAATELRWLADNPGVDRGGLSETDAERLLYAAAERLKRDADRRAS